MGFKKEITGKDLPLYPYELDSASGAVYYFDKEKKRNRLCRYVEVSGKIVYLQNDEEKLELTLMTSAQHFKKIKISRGDLIRKRMDALAAKGVDITDENCGNVLAYLHYAEKSAPTRYYHSKLGWDYSSGEEEEDVDDTKASKTFFHYELIGEGPPSCHKNANMLKPRGTLSAWVEMVKTQVLGQMAMELVLAAGFSSMLIPRLQGICNCKSLLLHISGNSSSGKTTAEMLAISAFANPECELLFKSWTATQNALFSSFNGNFGFPMAIDESSAATKADFTNFIYTFSQGKGKDRARSDGSLNSAPKWSFTLLSSGEARLPHNSNTGLTVRLIEISNRSLTKSAENADAIRSVISRNYGHASIELAKHLLTVTEQTLHDDYEACKAQLLTMISKKDDFSKRAANMLSVIILTAKYVNDALDLGLDVDNIANLLVELDSKQNRDIGMQALEVLHQYTVSHANAFLRQTGKSNSRSNSDLFSCNTIGTYSCLNGEIEIAVLKSELPHILNQFGFSNPDVVLAHWKAQGILSCDADRFTRIRKINGAPVPVNVVKFNPTMG